MLQLLIPPQAAERTAPPSGAQRGNFVSGALLPGAWHEAGLGVSCLAILGRGRRGGKGFQGPFSSSASLSQAEPARPEEEKERATKARADQSATESTGRCNGSCGWRQPEMVSFPSGLLGES